MADVDLTLRGPITTTGGTTSTVQGTSRTDTAVGDYILVVAGDDYINPADLTIQASTGVDSWAEVPAGASATDYDVKAWIGKVNTAGARTVTVSQGSGASGLHVHVGTLNPNGGTVTVDGTPTAITTDTSSPFTHSAVSPVGTKSLLVCAHGQVQFSGTTAYGAAPSGMTAAANYVNAFSGLQTCTQVLTAAGSTGTRDQTSTPTTITSGAGLMFALRSQTGVGGPGSSAVLYPTTVDTTSGTTWANTANATGSTTGNNATFTTTTNGAVGSIRLSGYSAQSNTNGGVQPASVDSVDVSVKFYVTNATSRYTSVTVQLYSGTTPIGSPTALTLSISTTNEQTVTLTGANCPSWAQLSDLRAQVVGTKAGTQASVLNLDRVGVKVNYTTAATPSPPVVGAGADAAIDLGQTFTRTATETNSPTSRAWTILSGPGSGTTIGTAAALSWTPSSAGTYVLRYTATNAGGSGTDDVQVIVSAPAGSTRVNYSVSPAFGVESQTTNWYGQGARATDLVGFARSTGFRNTAAGDMVTARWDVTPGQQTDSSIQVKATWTGDLTVGIDFYDATTYLTSASAQIAVTSGQVMQVGVSTVVPATAVQALMVLAGSGAFEATAHLVEIGTSEFGSYFDGDTPGASWDGTAGASTSRLVSAASGSFEPGRFLLIG